VITWILLRAAGIGAYVALFLSVAWGLVMTTGVVARRVSKPAANTFHAAVATCGLALLGVHLGLLLVDPYMPFRWNQVLVPMASTYRPVAIAIGVGAMYLVVAVLATSWARKRIGTRWWRRIHLLATPAFVLALLHGLFAGSDSGQTWAIALYGATGSLTLFLVLVRGLTAGLRPAPREAPARSLDARKREPASAA
jgi:DMSO/TMAO reductase YedYZ heme-binding membrane subunit